MSVTVSPSEITTVTESNQTLRRRLTLDLLPLMDQTSRKRKFLPTPNPPIDDAIPGLLVNVKRFRRSSAMHNLTDQQASMDYITACTSDDGTQNTTQNQEFPISDNRLISCDELVQMLNSTSSQLLILDIRSLAAQAKSRIRGAVGIPCESRVKLRRTLPILDKYIQERNSTNKQTVIICPDDNLDELPAIKELLDCMVHHICVVHALNVKILKGGFREFRLHHPQLCECPSDILHKIQLQVKQGMTQKHVDECESELKPTDSSFGPLSSLASYNPLLLPGLGISPDFHTTPLNALKKSYLRLKNEFIPDSAQLPLYPITPLPIHPDELDTPKNVYHAQASQILPFLYLGNESDSANSQALKSKGIEYVLNITLKTQFLDELKFKCCRLAVSDLPSQDLRPYFSTAFQFIEEARQSGHAILVHCQAGVSRSPAFVIAYLMAYSNMSLLQAYQLVKSKRSVISPNFSFMGQLCEFETDLLAERAVRQPDILHSILVQDPIYLKHLADMPQSDLTNPDRKRTFWNHFFSQETVVS